MKYIEINELKNKIMIAVNDAVNEMLDQLQANELAQAANGKRDISLELGHFDAKLTIDLLKRQGPSGDGMQIVCNSAVALNK